MKEEREEEKRRINSPVLQGGEYYQKNPKYQSGNMIYS